MASTMTSQRPAYTHQSPTEDAPEQDDIDRELDWLIQKSDAKTDDSAVAREQQDLPPRPAMGDFYSTMDDEESLIPNDYDIYDFKRSETDDEKLRSIGYDPEELERQGKREEILRTIKTGERNFLEGRQESHQTQLMDMNERLRELNEQLKRDSSPEEGRRRTIGFKENLVEVSAPPPDISEDEEGQDEEEGPGPGGDTTYVPSTPADTQDNTGRVTTPSVQGDAGQQQQQQVQPQQQQQAQPRQQQLQKQLSWADSSDDEVEDEAAEQRRVMAAVRQDRQEKARQERLDPFASSGNRLQPHGGSSDSVVSDDDVDRKSSSAPASVGSGGAGFSASGPASPPPPEKKSRDTHDPASTTIQGSARGSGRKEKVLIEREGTFELVSADDITARDMGLLPPMPSDDEEKDEQQQQKKEDGEEEAQPRHVPKPPPGRPVSASVAQNNKVQQSRRSWSAQPRSRSQERPGWDSDNFNYRSPYGLSDEQKKELAKQKKTRAEREKLESKRQQREKDYLQEEASGAFDSWLKKKRRDNRDQRKDEQEEERHRREQEQKEKKNTQTGTENEKEEKSMDHKCWTKKKRHERRRTRSEERDKLQELDDSYFLRSREDCDKAFKRWLQRKNADSRRKKTALATNARVAVLAQRRCRKSQQLASAIRQAQSFRYVDYYGYRN